ncbi:MAG: VOC family protein [Alkalispirochaeta sp.]
MNAIPYLTFPGTCEEALTLYAGVLGGEVSMIRFSDMPPNGDMPISDAWKNKVLHASLSLDNGSMLYFSDVFEGGSVTAGDNVAVHLDVDEEGDVRRFFDGLADGATVTMPVATQFWGAVYGSLVDRFGINWGFHFELP